MEEPCSATPAAANTTTKPTLAIAGLVSDRAARR